MGYMALFLRQDGSRSELQQRVAAELQEKLKNKPGLQYEKPDPAILDNQHETRFAGRVILVVIFILIAAIVMLMLRVGGII